MVDCTMFVQIGHFCLAYHLTRRSIEGVLRTEGKTQHVGCIFLRRPEQETESFPGFVDLPQVTT
jgi:hypothetical protein